MTFEVTGQSDKRLLDMWELSQNVLGRRRVRSAKALRSRGIWSIGINGKKVSVLEHSKPGKEAGDMLTRQGPRHHGGLCWPWGGCWTSAYHLQFGWHLSMCSALSSGEG